MTLQTDSPPVTTMPGDSWTVSARQRSLEFARRLSPYVLPLVLLVIGLPFVCLAFYAVPASDDFCKAALAFNGVKQATVYDFVRLYYWGWSSRWATSFLQGFVMHTPNLLARYPVFLLTIMASQIGALAYFFSAVLRVTYRNAIVVAALFYVVWLSTLESPGENVYWLTGATEYMLSLTLMLLVAGLLCSRRSLWKDVCACAFSLLIPAQHEMAGAFLCAFLLVGVAVAWISKRPVRPWAICLFAAVASLGFVLGSPAAHLRAIEEHRHLWDFAHAATYGKATIAKALEWMLAPTALLGAACACFYLPAPDSGSDPTWCSPAWQAVLCLSGMIVALLEFFAIELAGGWLLPDRALGWLHFLFWLFFFLGILAGRRALAAVGQSIGLQMGLVALLFLALASANFRSAVSDLIGPARSWRQTNSQRLLARGDVIQWAPLPQKPKLLMNAEVSRDPAWWENGCEANYLNVRSVLISPPQLGKQ